MSDSNKKPKGNASSLLARINKMNEEGRHFFRVQLLVHLKLNRTKEKWIPYFGYHDAQYEADAVDAAKKVILQQILDGKARGITMPYKEPDPRSLIFDEGPRFFDSMIFYVQEVEWLDRESLTALAARAKPLSEVTKRQEIFK